MEELQLTTPVTSTTSKFHVTAILLDLEFPGGAELGIVRIDCKDNLNVPYSHSYVGAEAVTMIKQLNTANLSTKSLHKRCLEKLSADGFLPGTVVGTPDP